MHMNLLALCAAAVAFTLVTFAAHQFARLLGQGGLSLHLPGPRALPLFGNLFQVSLLLWREC